LGLSILRTNLSGDTAYFEDFPDEVRIFEQVRFYFEVLKNVLSDESIEFFLLIEAIE